MTALPNRDRASGRPDQPAWLRRRRPRVARAIEAAQRRRARRQGGGAECPTLPANDNAVLTRGAPARRPRCG